MNAHRPLPAWQQGILDTSRHSNTEWVKADKQAMMRQSIAQLFEAQVARNPDSLAVMTDSIQLTYAELNRAANRVAHSILAEQQESISPIALCCSQRALLVVGMLGVLKSGRCLVILDHDSQAERNAYILSDSKAKLLYTDLDSLDFALHSTDGYPYQFRIDQLDSPATDDNLNGPSAVNANIRLVYTSGSTGKSKGVVQTERHVIHATVNLHNTIRLTSDDRLLYHAAPGFTGVLAPLLGGASIFPVNLKREGFSVIAERIRHEGVTILHTVPTVLRHFVSTLGSDETFLLPRVIILIGEPVPRTDFELFRRYFPAATFVNFLGSKESLDYRVFVCTRETQITDDFLPAGYPLDDTEVLLVDPAGQPVGEQEIGEIVVKGYYLSPGYLGRPELTAQKFKADPSGSDKRLYFTGDLGKLLPDGCLVTLGRNDFQVKIRGYQVNIHEVETTLTQVDAVAECAVMLNNERLENLSLDAYVVPRQPAVTVTALRALLASKLPDYMLPSRFIYVDKLPYSSLGKVDRSALKSLLTPRPFIDAPFAQASTPFEKTIAAIWTGILGLDAIGIHDPFLELGGNSLQAMRIAARVQDEFGVEIPLAELFAAATVAEMALVITQKLVQVFPDVLR